MKDAGTISSTTKHTTNIPKKNYTPPLLSPTSLISVKPSIPKLITKTPSKSPISNSKDDPDLLQAAEEVLQHQAHLQQLQAHKQQICAELRAKVEKMKLQKEEQKENQLLQTNKESIEEYSRILLNPGRSISMSEFRIRMNKYEFHKFSEIELKNGVQNRMNRDFFIVGVMVEKSQIKKARNQKDFIKFAISDLKKRCPKGTNGKSSIKSKEMETGKKGNNVNVKAEGNEKSYLKNTKKNEEELFIQHPDLAKLKEKEKEKDKQNESGIVELSSHLTQARFVNGYKVVDIICFDEDTIKKIANETVGNVYAILNPYPLPPNKYTPKTIEQSPSNPNKTKPAIGGHYTLKISSINQMLRIGSSFDFGYCQTTFGNGQYRCTNYVNTALEKLCQQHSSKIVTQLQNNRPALRSEHIDVNALKQKRRGRISEKSDAANRWSQVVKNRGGVEKGGWGEALMYNKLLYSPPAKKKQNLPITQSEKVKIKNHSRNQELMDLIGNRSSVNTLSYNIRDDEDKQNEEKRKEQQAKFVEKEGEKLKNYFQKRKDLTQDKSFNKMAGKVGGRLANNNLLDLPKSAQKNKNIDLSVEGHEESELTEPTEVMPPPEASNLNIKNNQQETQKIDINEFFKRRGKTSKTVDLEIDIVKKVYQSTITSDYNIKSLLAKKKQQFSERFPKQVTTSPTPSFIKKDITPEHQ